MNLETMVFARPSKSGFRLGVGLILLLAPSASFAHGTHSLLLAHVDAALAERPEDGGLWYCRAQLDFEHDNLAESLIDVDKADRFSPGKFPLLWLKGRILNAAGKPEEALSALDSFVASHPGHSGALASRARVEAKLGLGEKANTDFNAALAGDPEAGPDLVQEVAQALASGGQTDEAIRILESALSRLGSVPSLQLKLIEIEVSNNRHDSALGRIEGFQQSAPRPEPWMARRAGILAQAGRLADSHAVWQSLIDHIRRLPDRDSHAMTILNEQAYQAISILARTLSSP